ncbi:hypothetical protein [Anabaena sp. 4-3]|uniref:hypothetical protein n=1 Tax=Anabaena sp. 4-3 TaxID=1811979 RepID=UPI00082E18E2|nr:hypothetical protein [Anabaena sp. 4-3]
MRLVNFQLDDSVISLPEQMAAGLRWDNELKDGKAKTAVVAENATKIIPQYSHRNIARYELILSQCHKHLFFC